MERRTILVSAAAALVARAQGSAEAASLASHGSPVASFATVASVRALNAENQFAPGAILFLEGYHESRDQGGGPLRLDALDRESPDNGGTVFVDAARRRWKRLQSSSLNCCQWGASPSQSASLNTQRLQAATQYLNAQGGGEIRFPFFGEGQPICVNATIVVGDKTRFIGEGPGYGSVIQAKAPFTADPFNAVIHLGDNSLANNPNGCRIDNMTVDANGVVASCIASGNCQEFSGGSNLLCINYMKYGVVMRSQVDVIEGAQTAAQNWRFDNAYWYSSVKAVNTTGFYIYGSAVAGEIDKFTGSLPLGAAQQDCGVAVVAGRVTAIHGHLEGVRTGIQFGYRANGVAIACEGSKSVVQTLNFELDCGACIAIGCSQGLTGEHAAYTIRDESLNGGECFTGFIPFYATGSGKGVTPASGLLADGSWIQGGKSVTAALANSKFLVESAAAPTSHTDFTMLGLAGAVTPARTGNVRCAIMGTIAGANVGREGGVTYQIRQGSGSAPPGAAAATGEPVDHPQTFKCATGQDVALPFTVETLVSGLKPGETYWFDLAARRASPDSDLTITNAVVLLQEF